jgi:hypothetical protein
VPKESRPRRGSDFIDPIVEANDYEGEAKSIWYLADSFECSLTFEAVPATNKYETAVARPLNEVPLSFSWLAARGHPTLTANVFATLEVAIQPANTLDVTLDICDGHRRKCFEQLQVGSIEIAR